MPGDQITNPRKRRVSDTHPPCQGRSPQHFSKRQKHGDQDEFKLSPAFWDNLSTTYLTKAALLELDLRNTGLASRAPPRRSRHRRPLTRHTLPELGSSPRPLTRAPEFIYDCKSNALKSIKRIARHGGPDLSDVRGFQKPSNPLGLMSTPRASSRVPKRSPSSAPNTKSSSRTATTKSTGPYDRNFQQKLIDSGVYPIGYRYPDGRTSSKPENWEEIQAQLRQSRPSLSPSRFSEYEYEKFVQADTDATKEKQVTTSVIPIIEGNVRDAKCTSGGVPFNNLKPLTDGTLVPGNPDIYYGARPEELDRQARDELSGYIIPSTQDDLPIVPNFSVEIKGPDGSIAVAGRQACYDGSLGARGMHMLRSYGRKEPFFDNKAYTITTIYHSGTLKIYTSHLTQPSIPGDRPEYFITQLNTWGMTGNIETFRQGAAAYRNARDWAEKRRDEAIQIANERASERRNETPVVGSSSDQTTATNSRIMNQVDTTISQDSRDELSEGSIVTHDQRLAGRTASPKLGSGAQLAKRSNEQVKQQSPLQRKRHNLGD